jgi:tubulin-specific chaperone C
MWNQVNDFKWLKAEKSPNWTELPEDDRLSEEIWATTVAGGPGVGPDDILKATKIGASSG